LLDIFSMSTRPRRKRTRVNYQEDADDSEREVSEAEQPEPADEESEPEEYAPPKRKKRRTNPSPIRMDETSTDSNANWLRVAKLEKENAALKKENAALKKQLALTAKHTKKAPANAKKAAKKAFASFAKQLVRTAKAKKTRFYGWHSTIDISSSVENEDFNNLFADKGEKIQPTKDNKPRSVKTIIAFSGWEEVAKLFSDVGVALDRCLEVSLWRQGSIFRGKSHFIRKGMANVDSLTVEYNRSSRACKLSFSASQTDGHSEGGSDDLPEHFGHDLFHLLYPSGAH